jgi:hypothetical protein
MCAVAQIGPSQFPLKSLDYVRQQADGAALRADNAQVTTQYLFSEPQQAVIEGSS